MKANLQGDVSLLDYLLEATIKAGKSNSINDQLQIIADALVATKLFDKIIISTIEKDFTRTDRAYANISEHVVLRLKKPRQITPSGIQHLKEAGNKIGKAYFIDAQAVSKTFDFEIDSELSDLFYDEMLFIPMKISVKGLHEQITGLIWGVEGINFKSNTHLVESLSELASSFYGKYLDYIILAKDQTYFYKLIVSSEDIITTTDNKGNIVLFNPGAENILGYKSSEVIGKPVLMLYEDEDIAHSIMNEMRKSPSGKIKNHEVNAVSKSGEIIPISLSAAILFDKDHNAIGTAGISKDLRPMKMEQEQDKAESFKRLIITLSHHINNLLQGMSIQQFNIREILESEKMEENRDEVLNSLNVIRDNSFNIWEIIKKLQVPHPVLKEEAYIGDSQMYKIPDSAIEKSAIRDIPLFGKAFDILIADDDEAIRTGISQIYKRHGFNVRSAQDGKEAIDLINSHHFDIVISDIKMPHFDGYDVYKAAKKRDSGVAVVLMTAFGYDPNHTIVKASKEGLKDVFLKEKPIDTVLLFKITEEALLGKKVY